MIMKAESAPPLAAVVGAARWCGGAVVRWWKVGGRMQDMGLWGLIGLVGSSGDQNDFTSVVTTKGSDT